MTERKIYVGSVGPFLFDDADLIDDEDGDFPGENMRGMATDGEILASNIDQDLSTGGSPTFVAINIQNVNAVSYNIVCHNDQVVCNNDEVVTL